MTGHTYRGSPVFGFLLAQSVAGYGSEFEHPLSSRTQWKAGTEMHATPEQSFAWLRSRMAELEIASLEELAARCGSDKGNLSRIFHQQQRPRVDALEPLAVGLEVSVYELLVRIGAVDPQEDAPPVVTRAGQKIEFRWPKS